MMVKKINRKVWLFAGLALVIGLGLFFSFLRYEKPIEENLVSEMGKAQIDTTSLVADAQVAQGPLNEDSTTVKNETQSAVAAGAYLMSGSELTGWKEDKRWPIASITKLVSAYVAESVMDPEQSVVISQTAVDTMGDAGEFKLGEIFKVRDLVKAMLITSSNDAAVALAQNYSQTKFVSEMNLVTKAAGMNDSQFVEPTGLSVQNQSTVEDLVKLVQYIWREDREFFQITRQSTDFIVDINLGVGRQLTNINQFAGESDFLGGKTGTLPEADSNLISVFDVPGFGEPVIVVVLGSKDRFTETRSILSGL